MPEFRTRRINPGAVPTGFSMGMASSGMKACSDYSPMGRPTLVKKSADLIAQPLVKTRRPANTSATARGSSRREVGPMPPVVSERSRARLRAFRSVALIRSRLSPTLDLKWTSTPIVLSCWAM